MSPQSIKANIQPNICVRAFAVNHSDGDSTHPQRAPPTSLMILCQHTPPHP